MPISSNPRNVGMARPRKNVVFLGQNTIDEAIVGTRRYDIIG